MSESLRAQLESLSHTQREQLTHHAFDAERLLRRGEALARGEAARNRVAGVVAPLEPGDMHDLPSGDERERCEELGLEGLRAGACAVVVLAGGMATRMGGVVKALMDALPGHSFLDLQLRGIQALGERVGRTPPLWLMTSHSTEAPIRAALGERIDGKSLATFVQQLSLRLTPEGELFREAGEPSVYATGHGDMLDGLRTSGLLERFVAEGGRTLMVANIDNLGATLDPVVLGWHRAHGLAASAEVVDKVEGDRGGIPVRLDGRPVILEEFRLPESFDPTQVDVFNTNTFWLDARALLRLEMPWTYFRVIKEVGGKPALQFERLLGELTSYLPTRFARVPREGVGSRFLPAKTLEELKRRQQEIQLLAESRGML